MRLKRLEIAGFKSFADKVELTFNDGISAIVGPNGSGKSNVTDAVRWVIGEQSAKTLRGSKMEDVIFAGSDKRKPLGFAEVTICIDNSEKTLPIDYSEVAVTRRVFRSGDSEYFINKTGCRLKDINELFSDTGIGKEAYSIIGQGKIDAILSNRPEERRFLLEEAAGIVKYKNKKREATRKLDDTRLSMTRIKDIVSELSVQLEPLRQQAEKTKEYNTLFDELKKLEIAKLVQEINDIEKNIANRQKLAKELEAKIEASAEEISLVEESCGQNQAERDALEKEIEKVREELGLLYQSVERIKGREEIAQSKLAGLDERENKTNEESTELDKKANDLAAETRQDEERCSFISGKVGSLAEELGELEGEFSALLDTLRGEEKNQENAKNQLFEIINDLATERNKLLSLQKDKERMLHTSTKFAENIEANNKLLAQNKEKMSGLESQFNETIGLVENYNLQTKELSAKQSKINQDIIETQKNIGHLQGELRSKESRCRLLREMEKGYEGYNRGVREVMRASEKGTLSGICGTVAGLLFVPGEYEKAIDVALGASQQHIVVEMEKQAVQAVNFLKQNNQGRATFLPIETIKVNTAYANFSPKGDGVYGWAVNLVEFDKKYQKVMDNLLARIIVVKDMNVATRVAKDCNYQYRIITLDGDVVSPSGAITGGSWDKKPGNLLGRTREIQELQTDVDNLAKTIDAKRNSEKDAQEELAKIKATLAELQGHIHQKQITLAGIEKDRLQLEKEIKNIEGEIEVLAWESKNTSKEIEANEEKQTVLTEKLEELEQGKLSIESHLTSRQAQLGEDVKRKDELQGKINDLKIEYASFQQELAGLNEKLAIYRRNREDYEARLRQNVETIKYIVREKENIQVELLKLRSQLSEVTAKVTQGENNLADLRKKREEQLALNAKNDEILNNLRKKSADCQSKLTNIQFQLVTLETKREEVLRRFTEDAGIEDPEAFLGDQAETLEIPADISGKISRLKENLNRLGQINPLAPEEYVAVKERHEFLVTQLADMEEAKNSLLDVISEIDRTSKKMLMDTFKQVQVNFVELFQRLFGGGKAELVITNPEDILESGIEIIAQPPGKKPQNLSLLSGGERALTAVALIFAILKYKPAPFCILDEIDAALDEANVKRFTELLKSFANDIQFIVVTHRRTTMESADTLYGVTIEDSGVSKLISVYVEDKAS